MSYTYSPIAFPIPSEQFNRRQLASFTEKKFPPYLFYILITNLCRYCYLWLTEGRANFNLDEMRQFALFPDLGGNKVQQHFNAQLLH